MSMNAKSLLIATLAGVAMLLVAGTAPAEERAGVRTAPTLEKAPMGETPAMRPMGDMPAKPMRDTTIALGCQEVGNGDVATTVRVTNSGAGQAIPAGNTVTVFGSQGQKVHSFQLSGSLGVGSSVDVSVVPWQAVYQGCSATTSL